MSNGRFWMALAVAGVLTFGTSAQATLIDTFEVNQSLEVDSDNSSDFGSVTDSMLGGERDLSLDLIDNPNGTNIRARTDPFDDDTLFFEAGAGAEGTLTLEYDGGDGAAGIDSTGLGGIPLSGNKFRVDVISSDADVTVDFDVFSGSGNDSQSLTIADSSSATSYFLPFSAFSDVDFTDVGALRVSFDGSPSLDLRVGEISTVPAPAALPGGLALMGMLGLSRYRRRRAA